MRLGITTYALLRSRVLWASSISLLLTPHLSLTMQKQCNCFSCSLWFDKYHPIYILLQSVPISKMRCRSKHWLPTLKKKIGTSLIHFLFVLVSFSEVEDLKGLRIKITNNVTNKHKLSQQLELLNSVGIHQSLKTFEIFNSVCSDVWDKGRLIQ